MKKIFVLTLAMLGFTGLHAQFYNGTTMSVKEGTLLYSKEKVENQAGKVIKNDGEIATRADFLNDGTVTSGNVSKVRFMDALINGDATFRAGQGVYNEIYLDKKQEDVVLDGNASLKGDLYFTGGQQVKLQTQTDSIIFTQITADVNGADASKYIVAENDGAMVQMINTVGTVDFPIGDATNYTPLTSNTAGTTVNASSQLAVNVVDQKDANDPAGVASYLTRYWNVDGENMSNYQNVLTATYVQADVVGTESDILSTYYSNGSWGYGSAVNESSNLVSYTANDLDGELTGFSRSPVVGKPNLIASVNYSPSSVATGDSAEAVVTIFNLGDAPTTDAVNAFLFIPGSVGEAEVTLDFNTTSLPRLGVVDNSKFNFTPVNSSTYIVTTKPGVTISNGFVGLKIGFVVKALSNEPASTAVSMDIEGGSGGGETPTDDNYTTRKLIIN